MWDPTSQKIVITRDVTINESPLLKSNIEEIEQEHVSPNQRVQFEARPFVTVKRKERFLDKKVLKTQRKPLKLLNQFNNESL